MKLYQRLVLAVAAVAMLGLPMAAAAQSGLKPEDAAKFMGGWMLGMESPQGPMNMNLTVKNDGGKVAGSITSEMQPEVQAISDISKAGDDLVLKYMLDFQGQAIAAKITLTPDGDKMKVAFDFADGAFVMDGTATKK